jgi:MFS family permease
VTALPAWVRRAASPYRAGLAGLDRRVFLVVGGSFLAIAGRMSLVTFLAIYFTSVVGLPIAVVGLGFLTESLARALFAAPAGALTDRVGRKSVLLVGLAGMTVVLPAFLLVRSAAGLVAWSFLLGTFGAIQQPVTSALLLDLVPPSARARALALNYTAISLGYTLGVAPAGFVAQRSYVALAAASAALFLAVVLLYACGLRGALPREASAGPAHSFAGRLALAPRDPAFVAFAAAALVFPLGLGLATTTNTVYAAERGLGDGAIGLILSLNGVLLALFAIPVQSSVEGRGPYRLLGLAAALVGSSFLLLGFVPPIGAALTAHVVVFTLGEFLFGPIIPAAVAALAPPGARGAYQGAWSMAFAIGYGGALFGSGLVKDALGWRGRGRWRPPCRPRAPWRSSRRAAGGSASRPSALTRSDRPPSSGEPPEGPRRRRARTSRAWRCPCRRSGEAAVPPSPRGRS